MKEKTFESKSISCSYFFLQTSEGSSKKNDEVTEDLKPLLLEVRSLITSFHAHVSQTATPAKTPSTAIASQGPLAERALLDDRPVHPDETDIGKNGQRFVPREAVSVNKPSGSSSEGERHGQAQANGKHRNAAQKENLRPKPVVSSGYRHEFDRFDREEASSVATDLNSRVSSSYDFDDVSDDVNDFALPLHSSSPKKDSVTSSVVHSERSQTFGRPHSPLSLSIQSDHSDVSSLLMDQSTSTADTVISRDLLKDARSWKPTSRASSVTSSQPSSYEMSDLAPLPNSYSRPLPQNLKVSKRNSDMDSARAMTMRQKREELTSRTLSDGDFAAGNGLLILVISRARTTPRIIQLICDELQ